MLLLPRTEHLNSTPPLHPSYRPGVIISYLIGGVVAMLCAMAYMEFAAETRTAGASIVYTSKVFGKLVAW
jgi:amino acid transporter